MVCKLKDFGLPNHVVLTKPFKGTNHIHPLNIKLLQFPHKCVVQWSPVVVVLLFHKDLEKGIALHFGVLSSPSALFDVHHFRHHNGLSMSTLNFFKKVFKDVLKLLFSCNDFHLDWELLRHIFGMNILDVALLVQTFFTTVNGDARSPRPPEVLNHVFVDQSAKQPLSVTLMK